jgi:hypothetical protein
MMFGMGLRTKALLGIMGLVTFLGLGVVIIAKPALEQKLFEMLEKRVV